MDDSGGTRRLHPSGPAEADRDTATLDDHGHLALAVGERKHLVEFGLVFLDVDVANRHVARLVVLDRGLGIGSTVLAVDDDCFGHV